MTQMIDRNPEGRDTGEGQVTAVEERTIHELLIELIEETRKLRRGLVLTGVAEDTEE